MKIICNRSKLIERVNIVLKAVSSKSTMPILGCLILEVNNNSLSPDCFRANSRNLDAKMMKLCMDYEVPVVVGSDAHAAHLVGSHEYAYSLMKEIGFPKELVLNRSVDMLKKAMKSKKK